MSDGVKKIFSILIIVVVFVLIGAFTINTLLPNTTTVMVDAVEGMIYKATKLELDFNGNGKAGSNENQYDGETDGTDGTGKGVIDGF